VAEHVPPAAGPVGERTVHRVTVQIYGEEYQMRGDESPAHMQELAARVDARMREIAKGNPRLGTAQVAVLTALNVMNDLLRLEEQYHRVLALLEREWERRKAEAGSRPAGPAQDLSSRAPAGGPGRPARP
jgi:cell division protein ZapA